MAGPSVRSGGEAFRAGSLHVEGVGGRAGSRIESRSRSRRARRRLAILRALAGSSGETRRFTWLNRSAIARRSQGGMGRRLPAYASWKARRTPIRRAEDLNSFVAYRNTIEAFRLLISSAANPMADQDSSRRGM